MNVRKYISQMSIITFFTFRSLSSPIPERADDNWVPFQFVSIFTSKASLHPVLGLWSYDHSVAGKFWHFFAPIVNHDNYFVDEIKRGDADR